MRSPSCPAARPQVSVAPALLTRIVAISTVSVAAAHVKWFLSTVKSRHNAVAVMLQNATPSVVVDMLKSASFPAAVVAPAGDGGFHVVVWNDALSVGLSCERRPLLASLPFADDAARETAVRAITASQHGEPHSFVLRVVAGGREVGMPLTASMIGNRPQTCTALYGPSHHPITGSLRSLSAANEKKDGRWVLAAPVTGVDDGGTSSGSGSGGSGSGGSGGSGSGGSVSGGSGGNGSVRSSSSAGTSAERAGTGSGSSSGSDFGAAANAPLASNSVGEPPAAEARETALDGRTMARQTLAFLHSPQG